MSNLKKGIFRYSLLEDTLTSILGVPDIYPNECTNKNILAPTLKWKIGEVTVSSFYVLGKGEYDGVRITHEKHKL